MLYYGNMTDTTTDPDLTKMEKIRALLDKAESTEFPEEAEALTNKAVELMERYRIDEAMIADARPPQDRGKIIEKEIFAGAGPYVNARVLLAVEISECHSVRTIIGTEDRGKVLFLVGYETDIELTEMLYTSLLVQATGALNSPEVKKSKPGFVHGTAFGRSFLMSFAMTVGNRLRAATRVASDATADTGRSVALVLADRTKDVDDDVLRRYGKLRSAKQFTAGSSYDGSVAGIQAGNRADIGSDRRVDSNNRQMALAG